MRRLIRCKGVRGFVVGGVLGLSFVAQAASTDIQVSSSVVQKLGVRTAPVEWGTLSRRIETVGYVEPDERRLSAIHTYVDGWIRQLLVKTTGETVRRGQTLFRLYSPALLNAQREYLTALRDRDTTLSEAARNKLLTLGVSQTQIDSIRATRRSKETIDVISPQDGVVVGLNIREGARVTPETVVMNLADLASVWIQVEVFESQASWIQMGDRAQAVLSALPGKTWQGTVEYVYPALDIKTRTLKARVQFDNPAGVLKPNMYAHVVVFASSKNGALSVPREALIRSSRGDRVIVALGEGRFQAREVTVGMESGDQAEILSGLSKGENVVISGQFLLDSESNLKAGMGRLDGEGGPGHEMNGMRGMGPNRCGSAP